MKKKYDIYVPLKRESHWKTVGNYESRYQTQFFRWMLNGDYPGQDGAGVHGPKHRVRQRVHPGPGLNTPRPLQRPPGKVTTVYKPNTTIT